MKASLTFILHPSAFILSFTAAELVKAFIPSDEYRARFSAPLPQVERAGTGLRASNAGLRLEDLTPTQGAFGAAQTAWL
jgi:hypothetical protein